MLAYPTLRGEGFVKVFGKDYTKLVKVVRTDICAQSETFPEIRTTFRGQKREEMHYLQDKRSRRIYRTTEFDICKSLDIEFF